MASRQYKWQMKKLADNCCIKCGKPLTNNKWFCYIHAVWQREYTRNKKAYIRRNLNARSYKEVK